MFKGVTYRFKEERLEELKEIAHSLTMNSKTGRKVSPNMLVRYAVEKFLKNHDEITKDPYMKGHFAEYMQIVDATFKQK
jgi:hypothetical protein